ncbi:MAG: hypothetical protein ABI197_02965 [Granulicella sp.]
MRHAVLLASLLLLPTLHAQPLRAPDGSARTMVPGIAVPPIANEPFSAIDHITWTRPSVDGGTTVVYLVSNVARDSQGRVFQEVHRFGPQNADPKTTLTESKATDPVHHIAIVCNYVTHVCVVSPFLPNTTPAQVRPVGPFDNGRRNLNRDSLGERTLDKLRVVGTRETIVINPGTIGNDRTVTSSREFWYSPDLQTNLAVTRQDANGGVQELHLDILSRGEPDPHVFSIPPGFATVGVSLRITPAKGVLPAHPSSPLP